MGYKTILTVFYVICLQMLPLNVGTPTITSFNKDESATLAKKLVDEADINYPVLAEDEELYGIRLNQLTQTLKEYKGLTLNYRVFHDNQITIVAFPDGNIRVSTGLMDVMSDDELFAIIGHAIGHIFHKDAEEALQKVSAGKSADSQVKEILSAYINFIYPKQQEYIADEFGFALCVDQGMNPYAMAMALEKLLKLSNDKNAQKFSSLYPDMEERILKIRLLGDQYYNNQ